MQQRNDTGTEITVRTDGESALLVNRNTTIDYARFSRTNRTLDYIFVHPAFRRQGHARQLLELCTEICGGDLRAALPISPLGRRFCAAVGLPAIEGRAAEATDDAG